ncbi:tRNA (adenosine(37)-N6)-threonylcarbamoyltransferase complex transferase subunit TsaD [Sulfobacillus harzensis]|uniref:tRNA N6-adenosine threonylcarbamoyltransferase n=1 Tax=Sulfobacillus harzensis TaxID=2729629 RepID=A0A7Y0L7F6_9FIRM|nr:tRNA (adenosine(37)-N6)-threonylcarbamoyltransferase complex transferase subunit TsaD [Sulfobacillus harzensis]NMP24702.1 tRNA (adenosine(37)-N6)-threonylcarbamoyltransferase complex transferase subunit TsaD [Sulfobacillus harzensis]
MRILGIESSCDDTAAAIVEDGVRLIAEAKLSSALIQQRYGGVVPEVAAREHAMAVLPVVETVLAEAGMQLADLDAVAVTQGPGLLGALLVGVTFAKALARALHRPAIGVHHLEAHLYANSIGHPVEFPGLALIVSGGHTSLVWWRGHGDLEVIGATRDDAAGEALDKGARLLGLPYPGGPEIERLALTAGPEPAFRLPVARVTGAPLDFSFSGLKTATEDLVRQHPDARAGVARALQEAVVEALMKNVKRAYALYPVPHLYVAGGVAANQRLSEALTSFGREVGATVHVPPVALCTDNAAMVAAAGYYRWQRGERLQPGEGPKTPWQLQEVARVES